MRLWPFSWPLPSAFTLSSFCVLTADASRGHRRTLQRARLVLWQQLIYSLDHLLTPPELVLVVLCHSQIVPVCLSATFAVAACETNIQGRTCILIKAYHRVYRWPVPPDFPPIFVNVSWPRRSQEPPPQTAVSILPTLQETQGNWQLILELCLIAHYSWISNSEIVIKCYKLGHSGIRYRPQYHFVLSEEFRDKVTDSEETLGDSKWCRF